MAGERPAKEQPMRRYPFHLVAASVLAAIPLALGGPSGSAAADRPAPPGGCEGCEAIYERPFDGLTWSAVIPPEDEPGERLILTGTVFAPDGRTPVSGVVVYAHHTNAHGVYPKRGDEQGWARRHGYLRGWVVTNARGQYQFDTIRPAPYPGGDIPAHIHLTVKESDRQEYWIDDVVFADDPLVDDRFRARVGDRGGSGIIHLTRDAAGTWQGRRDIVLEP